MASNSSGNPSPEMQSAMAVYEQISWQILIDGKPIRRILSLKLNQGFRMHHEFELRVYHTELEDPRTYQIDRSKELLGKSFTLQLGTQLDGSINRFSGIITEVGFEEANGIYGIVLVKGYSPHSFRERCAYALLL